MRKGVLMFSQSKTKLCHTKTGIKMTANVQEVVWKKAFFLTDDEEKRILRYYPLLKNDF